MIPYAQTDNIAHETPIASFNIQRKKIIPHKSKHIILLTIIPAYGF